MPCTNATNRTRINDMGTRSGAAAAILDSAASERGRCNTAALAR